MGCKVCDDLGRAAGVRGVRGVRGCKGGVPGDERRVGGKRGLGRFLCLEGAGSGGGGGERGGCAVSVVKSVVKRVEHGGY